MKELLILKSVSKSFGKRTVLKDINISIKQGSFTTVIGCNGAGKSTTLRIMAGLEDRIGEVFFRNADPFSFQSNISAEIFLVHENLPINFSITLRKFIDSYKEVFPKWDQKKFDHHILQRRLDLNLRFSDFSRGQKTQFLLSMALASGASLLLCDEVTSMLDFDAQFYFLEALKRFSENGGTVVMTTNILGELEDYADHVILIQDNVIAIESSLTSLVSEFRLLKKSEDHPVFSHPQVTAVRPREGQSNLFLAPTALLSDENARFLTDLKPKLEDFLLLHFKLKQVRNEDLVA